MSCKNFWCVGVDRTNIPKRKATGTLTAVRTWDFSNRTRKTLCLTLGITAQPFLKANSLSVSKEIPRILWKLKVHYRVSSSPTPVLFMSQINAVHNHPFCFSKIHFNINFPSTPRSSYWSFPQVSPPKRACSPPSSDTCYMAHPSHFS